MNLNVVAEKLGAIAVLQGSVWRSDNRIKISARIFNSENNSQAWTETYDCEMADVFKVQNDMSV